jgi:hypothetical protein
MNDVMKDIKYGWSETQKHPFFKPGVILAVAVFVVPIAVAVLLWLLEPWRAYWPQLFLYAFFTVLALLVRGGLQIDVIVTYVVGKGDQAEKPTTKKAAPTTQPLQAEPVDERLTYIQDWLKANPHVGLPVMMSAAEVAQLAARPTKAQYDEVLQALDASLSARGELALSLNAVVASLSTDAVEAALSNAETLLKRLDLPLNENVAAEIGGEV